MKRRLRISSVIIFTMCLSGCYQSNLQVRLRYNEIPLADVESTKTVTAFFSQQMVLDVLGQTSGLKYSRLSRSESCWLNRKQGIHDSFNAWADRKIQDLKDDVEQENEKRLFTSPVDLFGSGISMIWVFSRS